MKLSELLIPQVTNVLRGLNPSGHSSNKRYPSAITKEVLKNNFSDVSLYLNEHPEKLKEYENYCTERNAAITLDNSNRSKRHKAATAAEAEEAAALEDRMANVEAEAAKKNPLGFGKSGTPWL